MIAIIDYGAGNLQSVRKALNFLGYDSEITADKDKIYNADRVILPGVGSFGDAMASIRKSGLEDVIVDAANGDKPFLGICLGLQLLFSGSEESPGVKGLGIFEGDIVTIPHVPGIKVPHIGWNSIKLNHHDGLFKDVRDNDYFYFVHSYYLSNADEDIVAATTDYGVNIQCAVCRGKVCATQFHPEKSGKSGLQLLRNFAEMEG